MQAGCRVLDASFHMVCGRLRRLFVQDIQVVRIHILIHRRRVGFEKLIVAQVRDGVNDHVRAKSKLGQILMFCAAAECEDRAIAQLHAADDVGVHGVADHGGGGTAQPQFLASGAHHDGTGLADGEGFDARGFLEHGGDGAAAGSCAGGRRAVGIEVGGDEFCAAEDHVHGVFHHFKGDGSTFADDDVVRIVIDDGVAVLVQSVHQAGVANDIGGAAWLLFGEKPGSGHGAGEHVGFVNIDAHPRKFERHIAAGALAVVG